MGYYHYLNIGFLFCKIIKGLGINFSAIECIEKYKLWYYLSKWVRSWSVATIWDIVLLMYNVFWFIFFHKDEPVDYVEDLVDNMRVSLLYFMLYVLIV